MHVRSRGARKAGKKQCALYLVCGTIAARTRVARSDYIGDVLFQWRQLGPWYYDDEIPAKTVSARNAELWRLIPKLRRGVEMTCAVEAVEDAITKGATDPEPIFASCGPIPRTEKLSVERCLVGGSESLQECRESLYMSFLVQMLLERDVLEHLARINRGGPRMHSLPFSPAARFEVDHPLARSRWSVLGDLLRLRGTNQLVAEIGVRAGDTAARLLRLPSISHYVAVDPYRQPEWGWNAKLQNRTQQRLNSIARGRMHWMIMTSQDAAAAVEPGILDLVFIDGLHDLPNALGDCMAWTPALKPDGILAGHDFSVEHPPVMIAAVVCCRLRNSTIHLSGDNVWYC